MLSSLNTDSEGGNLSERNTRLSFEAVKHFEIRTYLQVVISHPHVVPTLIFFHTISMKVNDIGQFAEKKKKILFYVLQNNLKWVNDDRTFIFLNYLFKFILCISIHCSWQCCLVTRSQKDKFYGLFHGLSSNNLFLFLVEN